MVVSWLAVLVKKICVEVSVETNALRIAERECEAANRSEHSGEYEIYEPLPSKNKTKCLTLHHPHRFNTQVRI